MRKSLDPLIIKRITSQVNKRFPEVIGSEPKIRAQTSSHTRNNESEGNGRNGGNYLLIYQGKIRTQSGQSMLRLVRVVVNAQGKIIKISTSH